MTLSPDFCPDLWSSVGAKVIGDILDEQSKKLFPYVYWWKRQGRKGGFCRLLARGKMNSILIEFDDGYTMITSGNSIRRR